jgi:hypothetical protein
VPTLAFEFQVAPKALKYRFNAFWSCCRTPFYQRDGDLGFGVYDVTDPAQVAALRLRYVLLGDGFPAVAMGSVVGRGALR